MSKKLIFLISFIFVLTSMAEADLVGLWRFDENSGTIAHDASGNGHDGTLVGDPKWAPGKIGEALDFDGEDDLVELGAFDVIGPGITLAGWIRPDSFAINDGRIITKANEWGENDHWWMLSTIASGGETRLRFRLKTEGQSTTTLIASSGALVTDEWQHATATWDGSTMRLYLNGEEVGSAAKTGAAVATNSDVSVAIGSQPSDAFAPATPDHVEKYFDGLIDDVRLYNEALTVERLEGIMEGEGYPFAFSPNPADGAYHEATWVNLSWSPGDYAISHDVYLGENFDDVNNATPDSDIFRGNQDLLFYLAGFAPDAYPDGLDIGTIYYWRIDEVNDAEPNSPWKGPVWSFTVPPKTAYSPIPADGAELIPLDATLTWIAGLGAKLHYIVFGDDLKEVSNAPVGTPSGTLRYTPGPLELAKTYYWRVDESDGFETYKGEVWSFTTEGAVSGPNPADGAEDVSTTQILTWVTGAVAASHEVYFGTDADAVANATKASPEYKGSKALGEESYDPGLLALETAYHWRIDEVNNTNPDSPWKGNVWSFTTGDFFVIDNFEDYNAGTNQVWWAWKDGLGYVAHDNEPAFPGNGTGSAVGDETTVSYTEETIVHSGSQSMPFFYDNNKQGYAYYSEAELTLTAQRDWMAEGVA
ncbi:MAG: LamG-like jellyroll fold domain-containing protein, partial [Planctomycetota bacterium]